MPLQTLTTLSQGFIRYSFHVISNTEAQSQPAARRSTPRQSPATQHGSRSSPSWNVECGSRLTTHGSAPPLLPHKTPTEPACLHGRPCWLLAKSQPLAMRPLNNILPGIHSITLENKLLVLRMKTHVQVLFRSHYQNSLVHEIKVYILKSSRAARPNCVWQITAHAISTNDKLSTGWVVSKDCGGSSSTRWPIVAVKAAVDPITCRDPRLHFHYQRAQTSAAPSHFHWYS